MKTPFSFSRWRLKGMVTSLCLVLALLAGCSDSAPAGDAAASGTPTPAASGLDLQVQVSGLNGGVCKLIGTVGSTNFMVDSAAIGPDGSFRFQQDTTLAAGLYFLLLPNGQALQVLLDADQAFSMQTSLDNLFGARVEGSLDNALLYENLLWEQGFQAQYQSVQARLKQLAPGTPEHAEVQESAREMVAQRQAHVASFRERHPEAFFTRFKMAGQNPELRDLKRPDGSPDVDLQNYHYRMDYWNNTPLDDIRLLRTPIIYNKLKTYITQITPQQPDSVIKYLDLLVARTRQEPEIFKFVVNWVAIEYKEPKTMGMDAVFVHTVDRYFTEQDAFWSDAKELEKIRAEAAERRPSLIGKTAQDITCTTPGGDKVSLYSLDAPITVLYIWNYECEHCQERTPVMKAVYDQYRSRGLKVYSLCTGSEREPWLDFIAKNRIQGFVNVWDPAYESQYYRKYHVDNTPEVFVLDRDHTILAKDLHPDQLPVLLDKHL